MLFASATHTLSPALIKNAGYDPLKDFAPIVTVGSGSWVLVVAPSVPAQSVQELIAYAKANPGTLNWGFGRNAGPHLLGELFLLATGIDVNKVPYKSGADAVPDMLGGRVQMNFGTVENLAPLVHEGKLRALVVTGETRSPNLPDVPTMIQAGFPRSDAGILGRAAGAGGDAGRHRGQAQRRDQCQPGDTRAEGRFAEGRSRAARRIASGFRSTHRR